LEENSSAIDPQRQQLCPRGYDGRFDAGARARFYDEGDTSAAPSAADFSGQRALAAGRGDHFVDQGRRNGSKIAAAEVPLFAHQAANLVPLAPLERGTQRLRNDRDFLQILRNTTVAIDMALEHFPIVDAMLPGLACIAKDQSALEFVEIARKSFAPLTAGREHDRGSAAKRRRVMILGTCGYANDDGLDIAADVDPVFTA
jgi:hypothetical protein